MEAIAHQFDLLNNASERPIRASPEFIQGLKAVKQGSFDIENEVCPICRETVVGLLESEEYAIACESPAQPGEGLGVVRLEGCGHLFCKGDIRAWLEAVSFYMFLSIHHGLLLLYCTDPRFFFSIIVVRRVERLVIRIQSYRILSLPPPHSHLSRLNLILPLTLQIKGVPQVHKKQQACTLENVTLFFDISHRGI